MQLYSFFSEIITAGFASCIALSIGRNEKKNADRFFTVGMLSALLTAVVLIAVQLLLLRPLCTLFANDATLYPLTLEYYRIILFSTFWALQQKVWKTE